jgi:RecB family exonuclease
MPPAVPEAHTAVEQAATLEELSGEIAPPLGEQRFVKGGMSVIADQSACPFRAFVRYRLGARGLDELEPGLTPAERGNVAHAALQSIWDALRTQRQLIESDPDDLRELLSRSVGKALAEKLEEGSKALTKTRELETRRLTRLLMEWLEIEKKRPPFQTWQLEVRQVREFGGVELEIRADRVDQYCEDGSLAILDYKTGNTSKPTQWEGERPEAPQLPLYSTVMKEPISTIAFAQLAAGELRLNGFSECGDSGLKPFKGCPLPEQIGIWREVVHALGAAFAEGHATVDPNKKACARCDLHGLCRVAELGREASDE